MSNQYSLKRDEQKANEARVNPFQIIINIGVLTKLNQLGILLQL